MNRLTVFLISLIVFFATTNFSGGNIGMSSQCVNSQCTVAASSSLLSVISSILFSIFILRFKQPKQLFDSEYTVGVWRRLGAFFVDYAAVLLVLSPIVSLPLLIAEASYTGDFQWSFYRNFTRSTDQLLFLPAISGTFLCLILYFYRYSISERQTLGEYVAGYKIIPADEESEPGYLKRVIYSFIGLCAWPVSVILALRHGQKQFWWDRACHTKAVRVKIQ